MDTQFWDGLVNQIIACRKCPRLVEWREKVAVEKKKAYRDWDYWGKPVPGFGDRNARLLVVGLAPGAHGSNRTGRNFTGDSSGVFLYRSLHKAGFANQPEALHIHDGLTLTDLYIAAACRCAPPDNKPLPQEIANCIPFLKQELVLMDSLEGIVVLGRIAFDTVLRIYREKCCEIPKLEFAHNRFYVLGDDLPWMLASYHPSRQNTQTGRLTEEMFDAVWNSAKDRLSTA
jgi:uracil-DNA glycosylase family 4